MDKDDIIRMAREADKEWFADRGTIEWLNEFAALVAAAEREECVKIVMEDVDSYDEEAYNALRARAFAILERGK